MGQKPASVSTPVEAPDFVFYTGCNVLKTSHIALLALDIMGVLGAAYQVMGVPSRCCGVSQLKPVAALWLLNQRSTLLGRFQ